MADLLKDEGEIIETPDNETDETESPLFELIRKHSHDSNNLLFAISANMECIRDESSRLINKVPHLEDNLSFLRSITRIDRFITDALETQGLLIGMNRSLRLQAEQKELPKENIFLDNLLKEISGLARANNIKFDYPKETEICLYGPKDSLFPIFLNLVQNSIDHGFDGAPTEDSCITIEVNKQNNVVKILFSDNGKGIPEETKRDVFMPGFTTRAHKGNTGRGLSIIKEGVVTHFGGTINIIDSEKGTCFEITLPLRKSE